MGLFPAAFFMIKSKYTLFILIINKYFIIYFINKTPFIVCNLINGCIFVMKIKTNIMKNSQIVGINERYSEMTEQRLQLTL